MSSQLPAASRNGRTTPQPDQQLGSSPQARTNIPQMRRARRKQSDAAMREAHSRDRAGSSHNSDPNHANVLWDPMTGERTNTSGGRPSQVNPAEYASGLGIAPPTTNPPQQKSPRVASFLGEKVRKIAQAAKSDSSTDPAAGVFSSNRPGWRGASGRSAIVEPVRDNRQVPPLKVPPRSSKRVVTPSSAAAPQPDLSLDGSRRGQTPPVSPAGRGPAAGAGPHDTIRPVVPSSQHSLLPRKRPT